MSWELVGTIVGYGIAIYVFVALLRFFENGYVHPKCCWMAKTTKIG